MANNSGKIERVTNDFRARKFSGGDVVTGLVGAVWFLNSTFVFHWFYRVFVLVSLLCAFFAFVVLALHFLKPVRLRGLHLCFIAMFLALAVTCVLHFSSMRYGYLLYEIGPLIGLFLVCVKKDRVSDRAKNLLCKEVYLIMTVAAVCALIFERNGFSDRGRISVLPGYVLNANIFSYPLVLAILLETYEMLRQKKKSVWILHLASVAVMLVLIVLMRSRGAYVAVTVSMAVLLLYEIRSKNVLVKNRASVLLLLSVLFAGVLLIILLQHGSFQDIASDSGRFDLWEIALDRWREYPFFGAGNGENYSAFLTSHNWFFDIFSQFGLFFTFFYLVIFVCLARRFLYSPLMGLFVFSLIQSVIDCGSMTQILALIVAVIAQTRDSGRMPRMGPLYE